MPKGTKVFIPVGGIQTDEQYFPDPEVFRPERFSSEERSGSLSGLYMPFGQGPRACIGMRMARLEAKVRVNESQLFINWQRIESVLYDDLLLQMLIYQLLRHFKLERCSRTVEPLVWDMEGIFRIKGGNWIKFVPRE